MLHETVWNVVISAVYRDVDLAVFAAVDANVFGAVVVSMSVHRNVFGVVYRDVERAIDDALRAANSTRKEYKNEQ